MKHVLLALFSNKNLEEESGNLEPDFGCGDANFGKVVGVLWSRVELIGSRIHWNGRLWVNHDFYNAF